jgi:hypothetical protein
MKKLAYFVKYAVRTVISAIAVLIVWLFVESVGWLGLGIVMCIGALPVAYSWAVEKTK